MFLQVINLYICAGPHVMKMLGYTVENGQLGTLMDLADLTPFVEKGRISYRVQNLHDAAVFECLPRTCLHAHDWLRTGVGFEMDLSELDNWIANPFKLLLSALAHCMVGYEVVEVAS
jgi:hypothetical protein